MSGRGPSPPLPRLARVLRLLLPELRAHRAALAVSAVLGGAVAACEVLRPWPLQMVFDHVLLPRPDAPRPLGIALDSASPAAAVAVAAAMVIGVSLIGGLAQYGQTLLLSETGQRVTARLRRNLFAHLLRLPPVFHARRAIGDILMRLTGDISLLRDLLTGTLLDAFAATATLAGTLAVMLWLEPRLTLLSLLLVPLIAAAGISVGHRIRRAVRKSRAKEGLFSADAGDALGAVAAVQAYGAETAVEERFGRQNRSSLRAGLRASRFEALLTRSLDLLTSVGVAVTLGLGAWSVRDGRLTAGGLLVFLAYQRTLYRPIRQLARLVSRAAKAAACGERVIEILETDGAIADRAGAVPAPPLRGDIRFDSVTVRYPRGDIALDGIEFHVPAGATAVIRGPSGAGKSTLASLVPRLLDPTAGRVLVDGRDIRDWTVASFRAQVAVVFQDALLLGSTIRENILLGNLDAPPGDVDRAALDAGVWEFASRLPLGLDTVAGERGAQLSGGQRQRVALARAALRRAPILILDEPFAHLDGPSRDHVLGALRRIARDRTVLLITHQDDAGLDADLEIALDRGRLTSVLPIARAAGAAS